MSRTIRLFSLLILLIPARQAVAQSNLLVNGSFELACVNPGAFWYQLNPGSTCITGWTIVQSNVHYVGPYWSTVDGTRSLDLDGTTGAAGGIQQTFGTVPGVRYLVTFWMAGNAENYPIIKPMRVLADGQFQDFAFDSTGRGPRNMGWTQHTWSFLADDGIATLSFLSLTTYSGWGPALDHVTAVPLSSAAATPSAPSNLIASQSGSSVTLSWALPSTGAPTSYVLEAGSSPGASNLAVVETVTTTMTAVSVPAGTYFLRVRARSPAGVGPPSGELVVVVGSPVGPCGSPPTEPTGLNAVVAGPIVSLSWAPSLGTVTSYVIEAGTFPGGTDLAALETGTQATSFTAFATHGTYYVRIRARNGCGLGSASAQVAVIVF
jgi:choice-of-anchor C domain-containing protein